MKKLMSIKERTILIMMLLCIIIGICIGMAIKVLGVDAAEIETIETITFEPITEPEAETTEIMIETEAQTVEATEPETTEIGSETAEMAISEADTTTGEYIPETTAEPETVPESEVTEAVPIYLVNGELLSEGLQEFTYNTLCQLDIGWYYPTFLCQMYQESRFSQAAVSTHGAYGLCQIKDQYHDYFKQLAGIPDADLVNDPFSNIYVGAFLIAYYYNQCFDINTAISAYNTGSVDQYNAEYVAQVRQWESTLQRK